ncbi:MAG: leucine-rich repeat domain-containing protein, partial [Clostridiales bacterium]|nr:leucine-rich repeat domain-containing protein [Clostridiales bacterium]
GVYDHVTQSVEGYILTSDGYGFASVTRMVGSQTSTLAFGKYVYDEDYDDYLFTSLDPVTQEEDNECVFNFICDHRTVEDTEFDGYFFWQGYESGSYLLYLNGELYNYRLDLNGYGSARLYSYDVVSDSITLESTGIYRGTDEYEDESGEWEYVPASGSGFRFILNVLSDISGKIPVYIEYDAEINVTLTEKDGDATLYLDGYGNALYTAGSVEYVGNCVVSESHALIIFVPYVSDGAGGMTAGGKMYFNVEWSDGTFTVNTTGFVIDDTVLTFYEGEGRVVVIPGEITEIADGAFNYTRTEVSLVSVTIPANVTKIGKIAFQNNYSLERAVFLSETPIEIDWSAENNPFRWPAGNFVIVVPEGSQDAYKAAWSDCPYAIKGSVEVTLLPEFEIEDGVLVRYNKQPDAPEILDLTIPDEVTEIANNVFRGLDYIRSVNLNNVTKVGASAFENCVNLKKVLFTNVQELGEAAFAGCYNLANGEEYGDGTIELLEIVTIGANAFRSCECLKLVRLGENLISIGDTAFSECHIYEEEEALHLELLGDTPPEMGASVGLGNISMRIIVNDIEVAKKCFISGSWN